MKKLSLLLICALVAFAASAAVGDTFENGDLAYKVTSMPTSSDFGQLTVTGLSASGKTKTNLSLTIPASTTYNGETYRIIAIQESAFKNQTNIQYVYIRYGVRDINEYAFYNCSNLVEVRIPSSCWWIYSQVFGACAKLKKVYYALLSNPLDKVINSDAFPSNTGMTLYVSRLNSVQPFKEKAAFKKFATIVKSKNANDIAVSDGGLYAVTSAPTKNTSGELTMVGLNDAIQVTDGAAVNASSSYGIPPYYYDFVAVCDSAFIEETTLKTFNVRNCTKLTKIGFRAFSNCSGLTSVTLNEGLTTIDDRAFEYCTSLPSLTIPASVTKLYEHNFTLLCSSLKEIKVASGNTKFSSYGGALYNKEGTKLLRCPEGMTTTCAINPNAKEIGSNAFENCAKITYLNIPYGVTTIGDYAFLSCKNLETLAIPSSVTSLPKHPVQACNNLANLHVNSQSVISIDPYAFSDNKRTNLYVPPTLIETYKTIAGWKSWSNIKTGAYDVLKADLYYSGAYRDLGYTITSTKPETINGNQYDGRAQLTYIPNIPSSASNAKISTTEKVVLPNGKQYAVTSIGAQVAYYNSFDNSVTVNLGVNIDTVGAEAFSGRSKVTALNLNPNLRRIEKNAFYGCRIANDLAFSYGFIYLGDGALYDNSMKRILLPSSFNSMGLGALSKNNHLEELILNVGWMANYTNWDLTNIPTSCKLYVPVGKVGEYKNNSKWGAFKVSAGAYDFCLYNQPGTVSQYMTVIDPTPFSENGSNFAGKAKYVYNPVIATVLQGNFITSPSHYDSTNGSMKAYKMTEFGDSCLAGATSVEKVIYSDCIERIGNYAFKGSSITGEFTVPASCTFIGTHAFVNCPKLTELFLTQQPGSRSWSGQFYGGNASNFTCYVLYSSYPSYTNSIKNWSTISPSTTHPLNQLNAYFTHSSYDAFDLAVNHPVDWRATGLPAYAVTEYNPAEGKVYTKQVTSTPANTGVIISRFTKNYIYRLKRPTSTPTAPTNLLVGAGTGNIDISGESGAYYFNPTSKYFFRPTSSPWWTGTSRTYLKLTSAQAGSTTKISIDLFPHAVKGDVDGNGTVDVSDVTALINKILGAASYSDEVCDIDGNGAVNVSDVTALINLILG